MPKFKILSIDGGGIKGLLSSTLIERLSDAVPTLITTVDMLAGTSTGGIIALGIAAGLSPSTISSLYKNQGADIFDDSWFHDIKEMHGFIGAHYDNTKLHQIIQQYFGSKSLQDLTKKVLIPTFNLHATNPDRWEVHFMHNFAGGDGTLSLVDAAMSTSAAPTYFETWGSKIDGGVACNQPSMAAVAQAIDSGINLQDIIVLSLGTGFCPSFINGQNLDWGDAQWLQPLIQILLDSGAPVAEIQCRQILKDHYFRLNPTFPDGVKIALDDYKRAHELINIAQATDIKPTLDWLNFNWN